MDQKWPLLQRIDDYIERLFVGPDAALAASLADADAAGLPQVQMSPRQGKLPSLPMRIARASRVLEIGTLGGKQSLSA